MDGNPVVVGNPWWWLGMHTFRILSCVESFVGEEVFVIRKCTIHRLLFRKWTEQKFSYLLEVASASFPTNLRVCCMYFLWINYSLFTVWKWRNFTTLTILVLNWNVCYIHEIFFKKEQIFSTQCFSFVHPYRYHKSLGLAAAWFFMRHTQHK